MKNLTGFFLLLKILILLFLFNFSIDSKAFAQEQISEQAEIYYTIDQEGEISFKYLIYLSANPGFTTAISKYTLSFPFEDLDFETIKSNGENLRAHRETGDGTMQLILDLNDELLNSSNPIFIELDGKMKTSPIREVGGSMILTLPGSASKVNIKKVEIKYPKSFGEVRNFFNKWVIQHNEETITLKSFDAGKAINLLWGDKVVYDFEINKRLFNPLDEPKKTFDLNIPKAHNNQKVLFSEIAPTPQFAYQDGEGNIFFSYELGPNTEVDVVVKGQIIIDFIAENERDDLEVFKKPILTETKGYWLLENDYEWNRIKVFLSREGITESSIEQMDPETKQLFYRKAYNYVVNRLELANFKPTSMESYVRQGATHAAENRRNASPEDYVDFLSAIYREYGVPTRMVEGYVKMLNKEFYHTWLEFWCENEGWKSIDPVLENYSRADYFDTKLINHLIVLSRSYNYIRPRIVFFDEDEFKVDFAKGLNSETLDVKNTVRVNPLKKAQEDVMGILTIENTGNSIISMRDFAGQENISFSNHNALQLVVPGQSLDLPFTSKLSSLRKKENLYIQYTSINDETILKPIDLDIREQQFWWWNPLVISLKYMIIVIIVYTTYIILSKFFKWMEKYYQ